MSTAQPTRTVVSDLDGVLVATALATYVATDHADAGMFITTTLIQGGPR